MKTKKLLLVLGIALIVISISYSLGRAETFVARAQTSKILNENIVGCPTVIAKISGTSSLSDYINDNVTSTVMIDYTTNSAAAELLSAAGDKVLVIFVVNDQSGAVSLANFLNAGYTDTHIASVDPQVIKAYRDIATKSRASLIIDSEIALSDVGEVVGNVHSARALNLIVSAGKVDKATIEQIQRRLTSVWMVSDDTTIGNHEAITSGVTGIITQNPQKLKADAEFYNTKTLTRRPLVIAHRGASNTAPENTMTAYGLAYLDGADMFETDVYLTKDKEVILLHDDTFKRTTDITTNTALTNTEVSATGRTRETLRPQDLTLDQIKKLDAGSWKSGQYKNERVPALRELLQFMKGKNVTLVCEIKQSGNEIVKSTYETIEAEGMLGQVVFISFSDSQIEYINQNYPHMPCGRLTSASTDLNDPAKTIKNIFDAVLPLNATYNPTSANINDEEIVAGCLRRGLSLWPWTMDTASVVKKYFEWGVTGITTNVTQLAFDTVMEVRAENNDLQLNFGTATIIKSVSLSNGGAEKYLEPSFIFLEGQDNFTVTGNSFTPKSESATGIILIKAQSPAVGFSNSYALYSQPVRLSVAVDDEVILPPDSKGCDKSATAVMTLALSLAAVFLLRKRG